MLLVDVSDASCVEDCLEWFREALDVNIGK